MPVKIEINPSETTLEDIEVIRKVLPNWDEYESLRRRMAKVRKDYERGLLSAHEAEDCVFEYLDTLYLLTMEPAILDGTAVLAQVREDRHRELTSLFGEF